MPLTLSRPPKLEHPDTIRYEIDMLRHAANRLAEQTLTDRDAWIYLEAFLLHYRNLIEFIGKENPGGTDLHITNIWNLQGLPLPADVNKIHADGTILWVRYEPSDAAGGGRISQYLQHCTKKRIDAKEWEVTKMMAEIEPLLMALEKNLPAALMLPSLPPVKKLDYFTASTTVHTSTAAAAVKPGKT